MFSVRTDREYLVDHSNVGMFLNRWPRAFARMGDLALWFGLGAIGAHHLGINLLEALNPTNLSTYLVIFLALPVALIVDALVAGIFGNTPAKALVGVKPATRRGEKLGIVTQIRRNYGVWTGGLAMGILPLTLLAMRKQFRLVSGRREANYDERLHVRVRSSGHNTLRVFVLLAGAIALVWLALQVLYS